MSTNIGDVTYFHEKLRVKPDMGWLNVIFAELQNFACFQVGRNNELPMWTHKLMKMFEIMATLLLISTFCCGKRC